MLSRLRRAPALVLQLVSAAVLTVACQKVPLLAPTGSSITLTPSATALPINGSADIIAQVIRASGSPPHEGTHITFTTTLGTIQPSEADTDVNGRAVVKFIASGGSGTATITALSGGVAVAAANAVKIQVGSAAVGAVSVSASPQTLPSTGGTATITATVTDVSGNALPGVPVTFAIDTSTGSSGAGALAATVVTTDATGRAATQVTTSRTTTVSAAAGVATPGSGTGAGATPGTTAQTAKVTVNVNTTSTFAVAALPNPATVGQPVQVTITPGASTGASPVIRTTVDWGDGAVQSFNGLPTTVTHIYNSPNSFVIVVTGVDSFGEATTATAPEVVNPRTPLTVTVAGSGLKVNQPTLLAATVTGATATVAVQSVTWDFGDGSPQVATTGVQVAHIYGSTGTFVATAVVRDATGNTGTGLGLIQIVP